MARLHKETQKKLRIIRFGTIILALIIIGLLAIVLIRDEQPLIPIGHNGNGEIPFEHYNETENITVPTENVTEEICTDDCLLEKALSEKDPRYCDWLVNYSLKDGCYESIADENLDACLKVENETIFQNCIMIHANKTANESVCDNLDEDTALMCKQQFEPCYYYFDTEFRICMALSHESLSYCENDNDCLLNYSIETGNASLCDMISEKARRTACKSVYEGRDLCADITSSVSKKEYCWQLYAILTDNKLICTQIVTESQYALSCYSYFAAKTHDLGFCRQGPLELNDLWDCYIYYSLTTGDMGGCDAIDRLASTHMFECYFEFAKKYGNPHACDFMDNPRYARTCYGGSIINNTNLNYSYCADVAEEVWKNKCYTESAKVYRDISICDFIEKELERKICTDSYHTFINGGSD